MDGSKKASYITELRKPTKQMKLTRLRHEIGLRVVWEATRSESVTTIWMLSWNREVKHSGNLQSRPAAQV